MGGDRLSTAVEYGLAYFGRKGPEESVLVQFKSVIYPDYTSGSYAIRAESLSEDCDDLLEAIRSGAPVSDAELVTVFESVSELARDSGWRTAESFDGQGAGFYTIER